MSRSTILVCGPPPSAVGGGPTHMRSLWASPLAREFDLVLFETGSRGRESPAPDEPKLAMLWRLATGPFALAAAILARRPAVVHINTAVTPRGFWREWLNLIVCRLLRRRVIYQCHGGDLAALTRTPRMRAIARATYGWPDVIVLLSSVEAPPFERLGTVKRIAVVPNAVDTQRFGGPREHSGRVRVLGYLARLIPEKGVLECVEAVRLLRNDVGFRDVELRVAGSGPARAALEERIARHGLARHVKLLGPIAGADTVAFLRECDVVLLPTWHAEGLPYTILESLAAGTPVVTSRAGGIVDVVRDGEHGRFVEPRDPEAIAAALRELAANPARLRAMSHACSAWAAERLDLTRLARDFAALYRELGAR